MTPTYVRNPKNMKNKLPDDCEIARRGYSASIAEQEREPVALSLARKYKVKAMAEIGNPNSVSDAGVGALAARSAVRGAYLNVRINASGVQDKQWVEDILARGKAIEEKAVALEETILQIVREKL